MRQVIVMAAAAGALALLTLAGAGEGNSQGCARLAKGSWFHQEYCGHMVVTKATEASVAMVALAH